MESQLLIIRQSCLKISGTHKFGSDTPKFFSVNFQILWNTLYSSIMYKGLPSPGSLPGGPGPCTCAAPRPGRPRTPPRPRLEGGGVRGAIGVRDKVKSRNRRGLKLHLCRSYTRGTRRRWRRPGGAPQCPSSRRRWSPRRQGSCPRSQGSQGWRWQLPTDPRSYA